MRGFKFYTLFLLFFFLFSSFGFGQLEFKLALMPDSSSWGVYLQPKETINPSTNTITGSGQITLVVPSGYQFGNFESIAGIWEMNSRINSPIENPHKDYISFGFFADNPQIKIQKDHETLLFTLEKVSPCPFEFYLIDNQSDPFAQLPNSIGVNPGNEMSVFDLTLSSQYFYTGNFDSCAWSCEPCQEISNTGLVVPQELEVFPNPSDGKFQINLGNNSKLVDKIKIYNALGTIHYEQTVASSTIEINEDFKSGMYFLNFENKGETILTKKILISK